MTDQIDGLKGRASGYITLRAAGARDIESIARLHAEAWQSAYRDILPQAVVESFSLDNRRALWRGLFGGLRPPLAEVAETRGGCLAGFTWMRLVDQPEAGFDGEIIVVAVSPSWQGRGIGRRLMGVAARRLKAQGAGSCYLWVYRDNRAARGFYERLGGHMVDHDAESHEGLELPIVAYGWKPIERLLRAAELAERRR